MQQCRQSVPYFLTYPASYCQHRPILCEYKKAGVILGGLSDTSRRQESLFRTFGVGEHSENVMKTFDAINRRYGTSTVTITATGAMKDWAMQREAKTPNYKTQWSELPTAR